MQPHIKRFDVTVTSNGKQYTDRGFIILPDNYQDTGEATQLVISCHGAGGTVTTDDAQVEHHALTQYLVANGYAVMDVNGLPEEFAHEHDIDLRNNIGSPLAVDCYVNAYHYCMDAFHLKKEVFVHGGSMGGISSTNLVLSGKIPVIAHSAFCPVLDTYNQIFLHPWSGGLPKTALGKFYGFDTDDTGNFIYAEEKVNGFNPMKTIHVKKYPVPVKFWHCEDDGTVSCEVTKQFVEILQKSGCTAHLKTFPHGGHEPQLVGDPLENPTGKHQFYGKDIPVTIAVEETFLWIQSFR